MQREGLGREERVVGDRVQQRKGTHSEAHWLVGRVELDRYLGGEWPRGSVDAPYLCDSSHTHTEPSEYGEYGDNDDRYSARANWGLMSSIFEAAPIGHGAKVVLPSNRNHLATTPPRHHHATPRHDDTAAQHVNVPD